MYHKLQSIPSGEMFTSNITKEGTTFSSFHVDLSCSHRAVPEFFFMRWAAKLFCPGGCSTMKLGLPQCIWCLKWVPWVAMVSALLGLSLSAERNGGTWTRTLGRFLLVAWEAITTSLIKSSMYPATFQLNNAKYVDDQHCSYMIRHNCDSWWKVIFSSIYFGIKLTVCWICHDLLHNMTAPLVFWKAYSKPLHAILCSCCGSTGVFIEV